MHRKVAISAGAAFLLLGTIVPIQAQDNHQGDDHGRQQQDQQHQQAPQAQQQHQQGAQDQHHQQPASRPAPRSQEHYGGAYHGGVQPTETSHGGVHPSGVPQHSGQVHSGFQQSRAHSWNDEHRGWGQRGGYNGYRIPDDRFRDYFGHDRFFRISRLPMLFVGGYPRFQYDGYWVTFMDPWPESWADNWYETDDCYLDWAGDGYYLYNPRYPGIAIAVTISF